MRIRLAVSILIILSSNITFGQKKFKVVDTVIIPWKNIYSLVDEKGKLIRKLDTAKYIVCINPNQYVFFAIFAVKGNSGWAAINADEKVLFKVYNMSFGEATPDYLVENKIRIIDDKNLIGFANNKGKIIIKPQFEIASTFNNGKAIIGQKCKKVPWGKHLKESDCHHYSIICQRHGYINEKGKILKIGDFPVEQIQKEIDWKTPDE